jgi:hypothetical protein
MCIGWDLPLAIEISNVQVFGVILYLILAAFSILYSILDFFALTILTAFNTLWIAVEDIWSFLMMLVNVSVMAVLYLGANLLSTLGISVLVSFIFTAASHVVSLLDSFCMS